MRRLEVVPQELPLHPQDEVECRRCEVHCDKVVYPSACVERECPFLYSFVELGRTYVGCMQKVFGVEIDLELMLEAEHSAWDPARVLGAHTHALLESLRARGLRLGLVSNAFDPGWLLHRDLEQMGLAQRLDFSVFSSEVGTRKPHPAIFERALEALGVEPENTLFVGDRLYEDIRGAGELGMTTVQALWFRADEHADGREPDHQAFTQADVVNVARHLA